MSEHYCDHGYRKGRRCPECDRRPAQTERRKRRSVYEDRPLVEVHDKERRDEQLRSIGIPLAGWQPLDEFMRRYR